MVGGLEDLTSGDHRLRVLADAESSRPRPATIISAQKQRQRWGRQRFSACLVFRSPMPPLWKPCAHKSRHRFGTAPRIASPSDRLQLLERSCPRIGGTPQHKDRTFAREAMSHGVGIGPWCRRFARSLKTSGYAQVQHAGRRAASNAQSFWCKEHSSLGRGQCIFASHRPCDAPPGLAKAVVRRREL